MSEELAVGSLVGGLISEEEAGKLLGRSRQWLRNLRLDGEGPVYVDLGNTVRYREADLVEWLDARRKTPKKVARKPRPVAKAAPEKAVAAPKKAVAAPKKTTQE